MIYEIVSVCLDLNTVHDIFQDNTAHVSLLFSLCGPHAGVKTISGRFCLNLQNTLFYERIDTRTIVLKNVKNKPPFWLLFLFFTLLSQRQSHFKAYSSRLRFYINK